MSYPIGLLVVPVLGGVFIFAGAVSEVYLLNRVVVMVMSSDLKFLNNTNAPGTNGGEGVCLRTEASSFPP